MTTCERQRGFTLLELVVVLGVLGILLGAAAPLAGAALDAGRRHEARTELDALAAALDSFYFEHASFPSQLDASDFVGIHLQPGVGNTAFVDPFGNGAPYRFSIDVANNTVTVRSVGENQRDDAGGADDYTVTVHGAVPAVRRTGQRLRIIVERLAEHIEAGGAVAGDWSTVRSTMGLGNEYQRDGWGTNLSWDAATYTLSSAGPDRVHGTSDDITL